MSLSPCLSCLALLRPPSTHPPPHTHTRTSYAHTPLSFVAGAAVADSEQQGRALVNTILSLSASTVVTFMVSSLVGSTSLFRPVDIQNATLAGGVAIGCTANLNMSPFGAIMIGCTAGTVSTLGFNFVQPYLEKTWGLHDTCGIHNLHAMPSVIVSAALLLLVLPPLMPASNSHHLSPSPPPPPPPPLQGALASVILAGWKDNNKGHDATIYGYTVAGTGTMWWSQFVAIFVCIGFAVSTGLVTGFILKSLQPLSDCNEFHDDQWWAVGDDYNKTFYSELGAIIQNAGPDSEWSAHKGPQPTQKNKLSELDTSSHHGRRPQGFAPTMTKLPSTDNLAVTSKA